MARAINPAMLLEMRNSHQVTSQIDLVQDDVVILSTSNKTLRLLDGDVSWDQTRDIVSQANVQLLIDEDTAGQVPRGSSSPLSPVSPSVLRISHGFQTPTGPQMVGLGDYDLAEVEIDETNGGVTVDIVAYDKTRRIQRDKFTQVYTIPAGTNYISVLSALIQRSYPGAEIVASPTYYTTGLLVFDIEGDPLAALRDLADSIGYEVVLGSQGQWILRQAVESTDSPQWTMIEGDSDTKVLNPKRRLSDDRVYNGVIVRGESFSSDAPPVTGSAWDTDPNSPTYYDPANPGASSYGPVPLFYVSEFITNSSQAADAAMARLPKVKGLLERNTVETRINPGIEIGDVVQIERDRIGITGSHIVESVTFGLKASSMQITTRERRLTNG